MDQRIEAWCTSCEAPESTDCVDHMHYTVCRPFYGWGCCDCSSCREVLQQYEKNAAQYNDR